MKTSLTIAGSDCSGGAGIQADLKTFAAHGVYGTSALTAVVAENTCGVLEVYPIPPQMVSLQLTAIFSDIPPDAVKIGMLTDDKILAAVSQSLRRYKPSHIVLDPVLCAKDGSPLLAPNALALLQQELFPQLELVTPNLPEAEVLVGHAISTWNEREEAARAIAAQGPRSVLVKGGHGTGDATDLLFDGASFHRFQAPRLAGPPAHGTGCTLSAAIAANLALGYSLVDSVALAKKYMTGAIAHQLPLGAGAHPTHHFFELYPKAGLPQIEPLAQEGELK
jgi:hydroxymethylpyrimidine/phosphomethylpyrimidine kinase